MGHKALAIQLRNRFQREIGKSTNRVGLPPFEELEKQALDDLFRPLPVPSSLQFWNNFVLPLSYPQDYGKDLEPYALPSPIQGPMEGPAEERVQDPVPSPFPYSLIKPNYLARL